MVWSSDPILQFCGSSLGSVFFGTEYVSVGIVDCWTEYSNTNVDDGVRVSGASTLAECQTACINNASCNGVDWTGTPGECWMSGPWSGQRNDGSTTGVTHYDLNRACAG